MGTVAEGVGVENPRGCRRGGGEPFPEQLGLWQAGYLAGVVATGFPWGPIPWAFVC